MPPPSPAPSLHLRVLPQPFSLLHLPASARVPPDVLARLASGTDAAFLSVTRTRDEVSIVSDAAHIGGGEGAEQWCCIRVAGPLDLELTGVLRALAAPLAAAAVPIFALSTWNTDWVLVPGEQRAAAVGALRTDGWVVHDGDGDGDGAASESGV